MISAWIAWRLVKFLGVTLFGVGLWGASTARHQQDRIFAACWTTTMGLMLTWIAGYALIKHNGGEHFTPWILAAMGMSLLASSGGLIAALRPSIGAAGGVLAASGFTAAMGVMIHREVLSSLLTTAVPTCVGLLALFALRWLPPVERSPETVSSLRQWFIWLARLEGASLVLMVGVAIPFRVITGISLDGGQGWIGWVHGALVLVYVQALAAMTLAGGWSLGRALLGFVASLIPGGTFLFEWAVLSKDTPA